MSNVESFAVQQSGAATAHRLFAGVQELQRDLLVPQWASALLVGPE